MCNHKWKVIATINYESNVINADNGDYGFFLQDKIQECQECFVKRIITRQCCVKSSDGEEVDRVPDWMNMVEGIYINQIYGDFIDFDRSPMYKRKLDYPNYPEFDYNLKINGETSIQQKIIE